MKTFALIVNLMACMIGIGAADVFMGRVAIHPLATYDRWISGLALVVPYWFLATAAMLLPSRLGTQMALVLATSCVVLMTTVTGLECSEMQLAILDGRAAGRRVMICFPPLSLLLIPPAYFTSFGALCVSCLLFVAGHLRPEDGK